MASFLLTGEWLIQSAFTKSVVLSRNHEERAFPNDNSVKKQPALLSLLPISVPAFMLLRAISRYFVGDC